MLLIASVGLRADGVTCWLGHLDVFPVVSCLPRSWLRHLYNMVSPGLQEGEGGSCDHIEVLEHAQHCLPHHHQLEQETVVPKFRVGGKGS